jgi:DNA primase
MYRHPYLGKRGISEEVQRVMRIGYCRTSKSVTIPWFTPDGKLANIKFRKASKTEKTFWYIKGGIPLRHLVYGIDVIYRNNVKESVIVEGEVDAMYLMTAGIPAIATGGSAFTKEKAELIIKSPIERLYICADNDDVGRKLHESIVDVLNGYTELYKFNLPIRYKDVNEVQNVTTIKSFKDVSNLIKKSLVKM